MIVEHLLYVFDAAENGDTRLTVRDALEAKLFPLGLHLGHGRFQGKLLGRGHANLLQPVDDPVQSGLDHVVEAGVVVALDLLAVGRRDLFPVTLAQSGIAKGVENGHVSLELFNLGPDRVSDSPRSWRCRKRLGQVACAGVHTFNLTLK